MICSCLAIFVAEPGHVVGSIQVCSEHSQGFGIQKNGAAFEFSKRKFVSKYGPDLPVWALLASGSTGGVRLAFSPSPLCRIGRVQYAATDRLLALFLPSG